MSTLPSSHTTYWTYVGNYGKPEPRGIYLLAFDSATGKLEPRGLAGEAQEPNFVVIHPNNRFVYAVTAARLADYPGAVEAYSVDPATGRLTLLNRQPSGGNNPAHLAIDPTGRILITANYSAGSIGVFPIQSDGKILPASAIVQHHGSSINPGRQAEPHPHEVIFDSTGQNILVPDLGCDKIYRYRVNFAKGTLEPLEPGISPPGSGPRHVVLSGGDRFAHVINELTATLSLFEYSANGPMREIETITVWPADPAPSGAEIAVHPNGRFLYGSNRGTDSIAVCAIHPDTGKLQLRELVKTGGQHPRHFAIDPTARFLLVSNMNSNNLVVFQIDAQAGAVMPTKPDTALNAPCCVAFVPAKD